MNISKRLESVASLVEDNRSIIDIGCDHALLSIYIALNKKPNRVIASDNKEGPLEGAKENLSAVFVHLARQRSDSRYHQGIQHAVPCKRA